VIFPDIEDKDLAMLCLTILGTLLLVYSPNEATRLIELIIVGILALAGERRIKNK